MEPNKMHDRRVMLKIKLKSLGDEIRLIRKEGRRPENFHLHNELWGHRMGLRAEAHLTHLAYGHIRGTRTLTADEMTHKSVAAMIQKYGIANVEIEPGKAKSIKDNRKKRAARVPQPYDLPDGTRVIPEQPVYTVGLNPHPPRVDSIGDRDLIGAMLAER